MTRKEINENKITIQYRRLWYPKDYVAAMLMVKKNKVTTFNDTFLKSARRRTSINILIF